MNSRLFSLISLLSIVILWLFQWAITVNIPWWDDFHGIILPVHDLFTEISLFQKFSNFVSLNNEHRVVNDRIFTLMIYLITGKFDLKALALTGFLNLIGIFLIFINVLKKEKVNYWAMLPVVFLIFHAQYYESLQSLMVPFQNFSVIFYMLLALYFLIFREKFYWGFFFAVLAILSHGNGILVFILGALILVLNQKFKQSAIWMALSVLTVFIYFLGYSKPEWTNEAVISPWTNPLAAIRYVFEFLGAYSLNLVEVSSGLNHSVLRHIIPQIAGLATTILLFFFVLKIYPLSSSSRSLQLLRSNKTNQFLLAFLAFFFATGILMGLTRTGFPILSRYTINSSFFLIGIWMFYVINFSGKLSKIFALLAFAGTLLTYYNASEMAFFKKENALADGINYKLNGTWASQYSDSSHVARVNPLLTAPLQQGSYAFPENKLDEFNHWSSLTRKDNLNYSIVDGHLIISGDNDNSAVQLFFSLESDNYQFVFPVQKIRNNPKNFLLEKSYYSSLYRTIFPVNVIPAANYKIYKIEKENQEYKKIDLDRTLTSSKMIF